MKTLIFTCLAFCFLQLSFCQELRFNSLTDSTIHDITFDTAYKLISSFLCKGNFREYSSNFGLGGVIHRSEIENAFADKKALNITVLSFYPCFDYSILGSHLFLASSKGEVASTSNCGCELIDGSVIYKSFGTFRYNDENVGVDDVQSFIARQTGLNIPEQFETLRKSDVIDWANAFMNRYKLNDIIVNEGKCGYFTYRDIQEMLTSPDPQKPVVALRYYFGFDKNETRNKIRIILCAIDSDGNIANTSTMWEKSWPPGNCN